MRLYNQASCTPIGTPTENRKRTHRSPPQAWIPRRSSPERRNLPSPRRSVSFQEPRDNQAALLPDTRASAVSSRVKYSKSRSEGLEQFLGVSPKTLTEWPADTKETPVRRQASWSPAKTSSSAPLLPLVGDPKQELSPTFKLKPRPTKGNHAPSTSDVEFPPNLASLSLTTDPGECHGPFSIPKLSSTEESSDDSTWLDFSLDGSLNPFHEDEGGSKSGFVPIRKAKRQRNPVIVVKPMPISRKKPGGSPRHFTSPRLSAAPQFYSYGSSAFVVTRRSSFHRSPKASDICSSSAGIVPSRTTPSRRLSPRRTMSLALQPTSLRDTMSISEHLSTYSCMLKSGIAFEHVERMMKRDRYIDPSVVELLRLAHQMGSPEHSQSLGRVSLAGDWDFLKGDDGLGTSL